jgi:hypothetical protein
MTGGFPLCTPRGLLTNCRYYNILSEAPFSVIVCMNCFFFENAGELRINILRRKGEARRNLVQLHTNPTLGYREKEKINPNNNKRHLDP